MLLGPPSDCFETGFLRLGLLDPDFKKETFLNLSHDKCNNCVEIDNSWFRGLNIFSLLSS